MKILLISFLLLFQFSTFSQPGSVPFSLVVQSLGNVIPLVVVDAIENSCEELSEDEDIVLESCLYNGLLDQICAPFYGKYFLPGSVHCD